jgi:hypothetical protein
MPELDGRSKLPDPDLAYRMLVAAHRGLTDEQSAALNSRLVLVLTNEIGDLGKLAAAIALAQARSMSSES